MSSIPSGDLPTTTPAGAEPGSAAETWTWSTDEESWSGDERYATREEAIEGALEDGVGLPDTDGPRFWTGRVVPPDLDAIAHRVAQRVDVPELTTDVLDDYGERDDWNEDWPGVLSAKERTILADRLAPTIAAWLREYRKPTWFTVTDTKEHDAAEIRAERAAQNGEGSRP